MPIKQSFSTLISGKHLIKLSFVLGILFLSGCSNLLPNLAGEPPALYELNPPQSSDFSPDTTTQAITSQILIDIPQSSAGIDTPRIAFMRNDNTLGYYSDVSWTDRAPVMFQTLLVNSLQNSGRFLAIGRENMGLRGDYLLKVNLNALQTDYRDSAHITAKASITVNLVAMPRRVIVRSATFSAITPVHDDGMPSIYQALNHASQDVLAKTTNWISSVLSQSATKKTQP